MILGISIEHFEGIRKRERADQAIPFTQHASIKGDL
jgi:hypothetical protein